MLQCYFITVNEINIKAIEWNDAWILWKFSLFSWNYEQFYEKHFALYENMHSTPKSNDVSKIMINFNSNNSKLIYLKIRMNLVDKKWNKKKRYKFRFKWIIVKRIRVNWLLMQFGEKSLLSPSMKIIFTMSLPMWRFRSTWKN